MDMDRHRASGIGKCGPRDADAAWLGRTMGAYSSLDYYYFFLYYGGGKSRCRLSCVVNSFGAEAGARFVASNPAMPGQLVNVIVMGE